MPVVWNSAIQAYVDTDSNAVRVGEYWVNSQGSVYDSNTGRVVPISELPMDKQAIAASGMHAAQRAELPASYVSPTSLPVSGTDVTRQAETPVAVTQPDPDPEPVPLPKVIVTQPPPAETAPAPAAKPWEGKDSVDENARTVWVGGIGWVNPKGWVYLSADRGVFKQGNIVPAYKLPPEDHAGLIAAADRAKSYWPNWVDSNPNSEDGRVAPTTPGATPAPGDTRAPGPTTVPGTTTENKFINGITNWAQLNELDPSTVSERLISTAESAQGNRFNQPYRDFMRGRANDTYGLLTLRSVLNPDEDRNFAKSLGGYYDAGVRGEVDIDDQNYGRRALQQIGDLLGANGKLDANQQTFRDDPAAQLAAVGSGLRSYVAPTLRGKLDDTLNEQYRKFRSQGATGPSTFLQFSRDLGTFGN